MSTCEIARNLSEAGEARVGIIVFDGEAIKPALEQILAAHKERRSPVVCAPQWVLLEIEHQLERQKGSVRMNTRLIPIKEDHWYHIQPEWLKWRETAKVACRRLKMEGIEYGIPITGKSWFQQRRYANEAAKYLTVLPLGNAALEQRISRVRLRNARSLWLYTKWWNMAAFIKGLF